MCLGLLPDTAPDGMAESWLASEPGTAACLTSHHPQPQNPTVNRNANAASVSNNTGNVSTIPTLK